jgi:hypothetical protein
MRVVSGTGVTVSGTAAVVNTAVLIGAAVSVLFTPEPVSADTTPAHMRRAMMIAVTMSVRTVAGSFLLAMLFL